MEVDNRKDCEIENFIAQEYEKMSPHNKWRLNYFGIKRARVIPRNTAAIAIR